MKLGAIEAGGTKFVVAIGDELGNIFKRDSIPTTTVEETLGKVIDFFKEENEIEAIGLGCFGPIDLDKKSNHYGYITTTPKQGWKDVNIVGILNKALNLPIGFDTDVNAAALGELYYGSAIGMDSCLYLTIGTGIGGGVIVEGTLLHGLLHPEMGHIQLRAHPKDNFDGICPYHGNCFEGLASGPSIEKRWGKKAYELEEDHIAFDIEAYYIAQALSIYILTLSPKKIILGGGVMKQKQLFPLIHDYTKAFLNEYIQKTEILEEIENYIVYPKLGDNAGISGCIALALKQVE